MAGSEGRAPRRRRYRIAAWTLPAVVLLGAIGWLAYYRATFHTFAWWSVPPSISYCGRRFDQGSTLTSLPAGYAYDRVMTVQPAGWPVYTQQPASGPAAGAADVAGLPCTMGLALRKGDHDYVLYGLVGGP